MSVSMWFERASLRIARRPLLLVLAAMAAWAALSTASAAEAGAAGAIELPLGGNAEEVRREIGPNLLLVAFPEATEGWDIEVVKKEKGQDASNLLYHSDEWHGPYPSQVYAWHVEQHYFPDSRWLCVRGYPVELSIRLDHPVIRKEGDVTVFQSGTLRLTWFNRPCTRGFGHESAVP